MMLRRVLSLTATTQQKQLACRFAGECCQWFAEHQCTDLMHSQTTADADAMLQTTATDAQPVTKLSDGHTRVTDSDGNCVAHAANQCTCQLKWCHPQLRAHKQQMHRAVRCIRERSQWFAVHHCIV